MSYSVLPCANTLRRVTEVMQLVQYCTQNILIYPQMSSLITTTTATSFSSAQQGWCFDHTPGCSNHNSYASACTYGQFDLCTLQSVCTWQYRVRYSLSFLYTLAYNKYTYYVFHNSHSHECVQHARNHTSHVQ